MISGLTKKRVFQIQIVPNSAGTWRITAFTHPLLIIQSKNISTYSISEIT